MTAVALTRDCPDCGAPLAEYEVLQDALFIHGGYGATGRTVQVTCTDRDCGWTMVREVSETRPPRKTS